jgi:hypothetical protein
MIQRPVLYDLYCGLGGWAEGFLAEGYRVVGFDIERHDYGTGGYPGELVLQDIRTLHGAQLRDAAVIVASPPCQLFSRMAMPFKMSWTQAEFERRRNLAHDLFWQPWRIRYEAQEAAGRQIPLIIENVCGAQKWIRPTDWKYGSFYLWGDIPALMPSTKGSIKNGIIGGGSWFGISATNTVLGMNPDGRKIAHAAKQFDGQRVNGERADPRDAHIKVPGLNWSDRSRKGQAFNSHAVRQMKEGTKMGGTWWNDSTNNLIRRASSKSSARKAASAQIAKIPEPLARHIARVFRPSISCAVSSHTAVSGGLIA